MLASPPLAGLLRNDPPPILTNLPWRRLEFERGTRVEAQSSIHVVTRGLIASVCTLSDGRQQIISLFMPGDVIDAEEMVRDCSAVFIGKGAGQLAYLLRAEFCAAIPDRDGQAWLCRVVAAHSARKTMLLRSLGIQTAAQRMAHLFCEFYLRMKAVDQTVGYSFALPLTQPDLAEMTGLSAVHTNRTLQELRHQNLISFEHRNATILDWEGLKELADFDSAYLQES